MIKCNPYRDPSHVFLQSGDISGLDCEMLEKLFANFYSLLKTQNILQKSKQVNKKTSDIPFYRIFYALWCWVLEPSTELVNFPTKGE